MHECTKTEQHQPRRSGKQHVAHTRGVTERTNWWDTTPAAIQIFGTRDRTTQTTPERTSKLMDTRAALVRRPTSRHSRRFVAGASSRHESLLLIAKTYLTMAEETQAQVNHMVGKCWCKTPHKHNRVSYELHPLIQRHIMKTNDRQSSRTLTHGPRNNNHNRTCRRTWITLRCADTANTYDTTHILRFVSIGLFHVPLSPRRSGAVTYPHGPKKATCNTTTKTQNMPTHLKTPETSRKLPPPHKNELPQSVRRVVCSGAQSDPSRRVDTRRANECTQQASNHHTHLQHNVHHTKTPHRE